LAVRTRVPSGAAALALHGGGVKGKFSEVKGTADDLDSWQRLLASDEDPPFQGLETILDPAGFRGRLRRNHLDQVIAALVEVRASKHTTRRGQEHIEASPEAQYMLVFQVAGRTALRQDGADQAKLEAGDFGIWSTQHPYRWTFESGDSSVFSLRFPQAFIDIPEHVLGPVTARALSSREGFGKHLAPFLASVVQDGDLMSGPAGGRLARNLIDLFATGLVDQAQRDQPARPVPLFVQVTDYIAENLADPDLDASAISRAKHISTRYLQAIFQEQGSTVTDWIRDRRMAGARRDLADPALREAAIADIAIRWGYQDPAYFSRLFRREFGESPRQWRTRALAARTSRTPMVPGQPVPGQPGLAS
jgi:AraC-like DNA-binding protein